MKVELVIFRFHFKTIINWSDRLTTGIKRQGCEPNFLCHYAQKTLLCDVKEHKKAVHF